jgi:hypothetical protein
MEKSGGGEAVIQSESGVLEFACTTAEDKWDLAVCLPHRM